MDKKTWPSHMLPIRDPPHKKRPTQTESEGLEKKNIPSKWPGKNSWRSNTYIKQNRLQTNVIKRETER